jgi:hypothetical protein
VSNLRDVREERRQLLRFWTAAAESACSMATLIVGGWCLYHTFFPIQHAAVNGRVRAHKCTCSRAMIYIYATCIHTCTCTILALKSVYCLDGKKAALSCMSDDIGTLAFKKAKGSYYGLFG